MSSASTLFSANAQAPPASVKSGYQDAQGVPSIPTSGTDVESLDMSTRLFLDPQVNMDKGCITQSLVAYMTSVVLVDVSGSTEGSVLQWEKAMITKFSPKGLVCWNHEAWIHITDPTSFDQIQANGGTSPVGICNSNRVSALVQESSFAVFATDGQVDQRSITDFSGKASATFGHLSLIVCVIVGDRESKTPSSVDTSVFSPMMVLRNTLILHLCEDDYRVFMMSDHLRDQLKAAKGNKWRHISKFDDILDLNVEWNTLPEIKPSEILQWSLNLYPRPDPLPEGYRLLSNGKAVHFNQMVTNPRYQYLSRNPNSVEYREVQSSFPSIALVAKNENRLDELSSWVENQRRMITRMDLTTSSVTNDLSEWSTLLAEHNVSRHDYTSKHMSNLMSSAPRSTRKRN